MDLGLEDKTVFITGSSRGIGLEVAKGFLREGARVILNGRDEKRLENTIISLNEIFPGKVGGISADITNEDGAQRVTDYVRTVFNKLDVLVGNLGSGKPEKSNSLDLSEWMRFYDVNVLSNLRIVDDLHSLLSKGSDPCLVMVSSIVSRQNEMAPIGYAAAKSAILVLTRYLSKQWADHGIRVNCVMPGNVMFKGGRWEELLNADMNGVMQYVNSNVPMKRFGKPQEIADAILFLASARASFITGSTLVVDGGQLDIV